MNVLSVTSHKRQQRHIDRVSNGSGVPDRASKDSVRRINHLSMYGAHDISLRKDPCITDYQNRAKPLLPIPVRYVEDNSLRRPA